MELSLNPGEASTIRLVGQNRRMADAFQIRRAVAADAEGIAAVMHAVVAERVHSAIAEVRAGRTLATTVDDGAGDIWLVRRVSQKNADFGVIAIDLGSVRPWALEEVRHRVDDVLSDAAATLERLDVARALNDAKMRSETELLREALIGSVSHELRTPLASILGAATVLSKSPVIAKDERLNALAGVVRDEA